MDLDTNFMILWQLISLENRTDMKIEALRHEMEERISILEQETLKRLFENKTIFMEKKENPS